MRFEDRETAGRQLGQALGEYAGRSDVTVLGLARGGVPVAAQAAEALKAPLDVFVVRKLGVPGHEELAMGAIASGGIRVMNDEVLGHLGLSPEAIEEVARRESAELERRERLFRGHRPAAALQGRIAILVDDGLATGASMKAAVRAVRGAEPTAVVVAVPVAPPDVSRELEAHADRVVCLETPQWFQAVGAWYEEFPQVADEEVRGILARARARRPVR